MTKAELVEFVREQTELRKVDAAKAVAAVLDGVKDTLKKGGKVQIVGFGTFEASERAAREGRNPHTGEAIEIEASRAPRFKAGRALKEALNEQ